MPENKITLSPLVYLVKELGIKMGDYSNLPEKDKNELKAMAASEIEFINNS